jgi:hypothetical protein
MGTKFRSENLKVKGPLGRHRSKLEDIIIMDLREIGWKVVDWMNLAPDRVK